MQTNPPYIHTSKQPVDLNTKPHGSGSLRTILLSLIGFQHYPPPDSEHYKLIQLDQYKITSINCSITASMAFLTPSICLTMKLISFLRMINSLLQFIN